MNSNSILSINNLRVEYRTDQEVVRAVNGIALELERHETLGLVGETGAGKTTTALSMMRLLPETTGRVSSGEIIFDGVDLLRISDAEMRGIRGKRISMIFQDPMSSLNPIMTVGSQIAEVIKSHEVQKTDAAHVEKRVDEMLQLVGIPARRKYEYPYQFSGGMKQRVVIALALACDPELLIADEPTTALDVTIQAQVLLMMNNLKEKLNTSMILISHDLGVIAQMCDKVAIMYAGEIIESGTIEDIYTGQRHHPYTVGLFGSIPNLDEDSARLSPIDGMMPDPTALPTGCKFSPRCAHCTEKCRTQEPPIYTEGTHSLRCFLFEGGE
ncbi:MAG: ABC transporter ATP-binding protein [Oscillospiraceae bacterium]|nr:ABC transporter ATP-binding protein [Oscillospiraceae bacterium]